MSELRGAGGTEGGLGLFLLGFVMAIAGGYLLTSQVTVTSGFWTLWGHNAFGLTLLPFVVGVGFLFFDGKSVVGWVLTIAGAVILFVGIIANLEIFPVGLIMALISAAILRRKTPPAQRAAVATA